MKTTKNLAIVSVMVLILTGPVLAATTTNQTQAASTQSAATTNGNSSAAVAGTAAADGSGQSAAKANILSVGVGQNGVSVNVKGGFSFGKSLLGKVLSQGN